MKILWASDCIIETGYGRVANAIVPRIQSMGYDVSVLAVNYYGDPHNLPIKAYPARINPNDPFGFTRIVPLTQTLKPDVVFILNDPWHVHQYYNNLEQAFGHRKPAIICYTPVDALNYTDPNLSTLNKVDRVLTYTEFSQQQLNKRGVNKEVHIVPHGIDFEHFTCYDRKLAKKQLGLPEDSFIVLNYNKNQGRKNIPLTIEGYMHFLKLLRGEGVDTSNIFLYLHMAVASQEGWNLDHVIHNAVMDICPDIRPNVIFTNRSNSHPMVNQDKLNVILSASDVGINTASAGGWELTSFEAARYGMPQVVINNSCMTEIWHRSNPLWDSSLYPEYPGAGVVVDTEFWVTLSMFSVKHSYAKPESVAKALYKLYTDKEFYKEMSSRSVKLVKQSKYNWDVIASQIASHIKAVKAPLVDLSFDEFNKQVRTEWKP